MGEEADADRGKGFNELRNLLALRTELLLHSAYHCDDASASGT